MIPLLKKIPIPLLLILAFLGCGPEPAKKEEKTPPNIVMILVDDLGKEWISAYGAEDIRTPFIDSLAASGILFNNVYAMPQCTPTRVTFLTGQYPFRHGWVNHWDVPRWGGGAHFDETVNPSLGIEMKAAGYATCVAGKWQIDDFRVEPDALTRNGFDAYCMWTGYEAGIEASANRYQDPYLFTSEGARTYEGQFGPDVFTNFIDSFIQENKEKPFFVYYPMVLTHPPLVNTPDASADTPLGKHKIMVEYADKLTGHIIRSLEKAKVRDNTLIIWTTDNGTSRGLVGHRNGREVEGAKAKTTEPGIAVPFIANWKGQIKSGKVSNALIDFSDLFPTFLDVAGKPLAKNQTTDGLSFKEVLTNNADQSQRSWILGMGGGNNSRLTEKGVENQFNFRDRVLRNTRYKLYIDARQQPDKFIDLHRDPEEKINLIDSLTLAERKENFEALLKVAQSFPAKDNDPRYRPNPAQKWDVQISAQSQVWKK